MTRSPMLLLPILLVVAGIAATVPVLTARHALEQGYRDVELIVDFDEMTELAASEGTDVPRVLEELHRVGVTAIAVNEDTIPLMVDSGRATVMEGVGSLVIDIHGGPATMQRVQRNLDAKFRAEEIAPGVFGFGEPNFPMTLGALNEVGVGWQPAQIAAVKAAGFTPVARPIDSPRISERGLRLVFSEMADAGMSRVLFAGKFVLGNGELLGVTAEEIQQRSIAFYAVELDVQDGTTALISLLDGQVVRTHSIGDLEMLRQTPERAQKRFVRGVRERNIRACVLHLFLDRAMAEPLQYNLNYIAGLTEDLKFSGYAIGDSAPFPQLRVESAMLMLLCAGVAGGAALLLAFLFPIGRWGILGLSLGGTALLVGGILVSPVETRLGAALLATLCFPTMAVLSLWRRPEAARVNDGPFARFLQAGGLFIGASVFSTVGGLIAASLLSDHLFMTKALQFRGTKLSQLGPMLLVAVALLLDLALNADSWKACLGRAKTKLAALWGHPFTVGYAALAVVVLGAGALWIIRTGNDAPAAASSTERNAREWLETLLLYRPRTKEFMFGHPALIAAVFLALSGRRRLLVPCLIAGSIGQASMVNTFCHIHTPIIATSLRTLYGIILGIIVGGAVCFALEAWQRISQRATRLMEGGGP